MKHQLAYNICLILLIKNTISVAQPEPAYRDLNKNGKLDTYENTRLSPEKRVTDLLSQMTIEEKAGEIFHTYAIVDKDGGISQQAFMTGGTKTDGLITQKYLTHFNLVGDVPAKAIARFNNTVQKIAENTRLGIPVTLSTDPRNSYKASDLSTAVAAGDFSAFPEPLGFAAIGDTALMRRFGQLAAREYRAVGLTAALHPMADLATEPRWSRISGTFGEDANLAARLLAAYVKGFQGESLTNRSVMCITKHFPGSGPQKEGWEGHFSYGSHLAYRGNNFAYQLIPFRAAIKARTAGVMTAYGIATGQTSEEIGPSFNRQLITDLLRKKLGFKGIVVSDWNTLTDKYMGTMKVIEARGWGVENLSTDEKLIKTVLAGVDQIGGETETMALAALVKSGKVPESLINASVSKILLLKFQLGLFDNPYVDEEKVSELVGTPASVKLGLEAQQKSLVLLSNPTNKLPLQKGQKLYVEGFKKQRFADYGTVVEKPEEADLVIMHLTTPYGPPPNGTMMERYFHQGQLDFDDAKKAELLAKLRAKPTVVVINLERPAVIPELIDQAAAVLADFGASEEVILNTLFGNTPPTGKLPFELPSSMDEVKAQKEDVPHDTRHPLFRFGFGLTYKKQ
jgi:beta-glucosidase